MHIFITGGAGFIGSHLVDKLAHSGNEITVFDNLFRGKEAHLKTHLKNNTIRFIKGDIRDYAHLKQSMEKADVVFHLAAQSNVLGAISDTDYSFETNVVGTYNVLKAAKECNVKRVIFSSSRESYGEATKLPVVEDTALNAKNAYGVSKVAGEKYCEVFSKMYGMEIVILRFANVYGARDFNRVIPIFIDNVKKGENISIFGGKQVIDFVSVEMIVDVLIESIENKRALEAPTNVGSGKGTTLFELAQEVKNLSDSNSKIDVLPARSEEVVKFIASTERFKGVFNTSINPEPLYLLKSLCGQ